MKEKNKEEVVASFHSDDEKMAGCMWLVLMPVWVLIGVLVKEWFGLRFMEYSIIVWAVMLIAKHKYGYKPDAGTNAMYYMNCVIAIVLIWARFFT